MVLLVSFTNINTFIYKIKFLFQNIFSLINIFEYFNNMFFKKKFNKNEIVKFFLDNCTKGQHLMVKHYLLNYKKYIDNITILTGLYNSIHKNEEEVVDLLLEFAVFNENFCIKFHDVCNKKIFIKILKYIKNNKLKYDYCLCNTLKKYNIENICNNCYKYMN